MELPTLGTVQLMGPAQLMVGRSAILGPVSQKSAPFMDVTSISCGEPPEFPQLRVIGSPSLNVPVLGEVHVISARAQVSHAKRHPTAKWRLVVEGRQSDILVDEGCQVELGGLFQSRLGA